MDDDLRVVLQVTRHAHKQLKKEKITSKELELIKNNCISMFRGVPSANVHKLKLPQFNRVGIETTFYIVRLGLKARAIVSVDYDDLFEQLLITVYGYTKNHNIDKMISNITESFYQQNKFLEENGGRYAD